jgi:hypothetical protein
LSQDSEGEPALRLDARSGFRLSQRHAWIVPLRAESGTCARH